MYECAICLSINHASRLSCANCGTIPACYAGKNLNFNGREVVVANGAVRACQHRAQRVNLRTVSADYYATE